MALQKHHVRSRHDTLHPQIALHDVPAGQESLEASRGLGITPLLYALVDVNQASNSLSHLLVCNLNIHIGLAKH